MFWQFSDETRIQYSLRWLTNGLAQDFCVFLFASFFLFSWNLQDDHDFSHQIYYDGDDDLSKINADVIY